jgi:DNA-directed RNA polymerase I, II, and III subunit RPABC3
MLQITKKKNLMHRRRNNSPTSAILRRSAAKFLQDQRRPKRKSTTVQTKSAIWHCQCKRFRDSSLPTYSYPPYCLALHPGHTFTHKVGYPALVKKSAGSQPPSLPALSRTPYNPKFHFSYKGKYPALVKKMATSGDSTLFEDHFTVTNYDQSKYDRVARISAISADSQTALTLDINIELYPMANGQPFQMMLATTLSLDGNKDDASKGWRDVGNESTLADMWDYVCYGKIYKFEDADDGQVM